MYAFVGIQTIVLIVGLIGISASLYTHNLITVGMIVAAAGRRNVSCSGEMLRYDTEHRLRRQLAKL